LLKMAREEGKEKSIAFNFSGHGLVDMAAYDQYFSGKLEDYTISDAEISKSLNGLVHQDISGFTVDQAIKNLP
jgi:tryptophan synthase beta chain